LFTGIVQGLCPVTAVTDESNLRRLRVDLGAMAEGLDTGASVAINGTCLTVTGVPDGGQVAFDIIHESLGQTNLGKVAVGDRVNVERSFRVGDEVGGHILSGHIAGQAELVRVEQDRNRRDLTFRVPADWMKYLTLKGYVALDGASLTIARLDAARREITVCLIPETIARTTLGSIELGDRVNLEVDQQTQTIVATVEQLLADPEWRSRLLPSA